MAQWHYENKFAKYSMFDAKPTQNEGLPSASPLEAAEAFTETNDALARV